MTLNSSIPSRSDLYLFTRTIALLSFSLTQSLAFSRAVIFPVRIRLSRDQIRLLCGCGCELAHIPHVFHQYTAEIRLPTASHSTALFLQVFYCIWACISFATSVFNPDIVVGLAEILPLPPAVGQPASLTQRKALIDLSQ